MGAPNKLNRSDSNFFPILQNRIFVADKEIFLTGRISSTSPLHIIMSVAWQAKHGQSAKQKSGRVVSDRSGPGLH